MRTTLLITLLAVTVAGLAQPSALPPWVVPVLRLVSETHVQPTTGIVLPGGERVLVSSDFAGPGDEVVVLDGGTDIVRHGRPARIEHEFAALGLEVLSVPGLKRAGAPLAPAMPTEPAGVRLVAYPPAEQIADGQPPVDWRGRLQPAPGGTQAALSGSPRPNVTGPLLDDCDNLLGLSLAAGLPTLATSTGTAYRWQEDLRAVWDELGLPSSGRACAPEAPVDEAAPGAESPEAITPEPPEPGTGAEPLDLSETIDPEPVVEEPVVEEPAAEEPTVEPPADPESGRFGLWALLAALLIGAGLVLGIWRRRRGAAAPETETGRPVRTEDRPQARAATGEESPPPDDGVLVLSGRYADGRPLAHRIAVNPVMIRLVIGRGGADIALDSQAVSRRHARLEGAAGSLTLTDLGSSNGTSVDGVPCLEGEVFYLESGASIVLADARFTIELRTGDGGGAP